MLRLLLATAFFVTVTTNTFAQCTKDTDCKGDRICVNGECVDPVASTPATSMDESTQLKVNTVESIGESSSTQSYDQEEDTFKEEVIPPPPFVNIWVNPLGFLQYGPTAGVEFKLADDLTIGVHGRYAAMGFLYNALVGSDNYDGVNEIWMKSGAVGIESKYYTNFTSSAHGLYYGIVAEYIWGGYTHYKENWDSYADDYDLELDFTARHQSIGLGGTLGFRWRFGDERNKLLSVGFLSGVARELLDERTYADNRGVKSQLKENVFFLMVELAIGRGF